MLHEPNVLLSTQDTHMFFFAKAIDLAIAESKSEDLTINLQKPDFYSYIGSMARALQLEYEISLDEMNRLHKRRVSNG